MDFSPYIINDYDRLDEENIDTELFTKLTDVEIIDDNHKFIAFLNGFTHYLAEGEILHGWYHIPTKTAKFFVKNHPSRYGNLIHWAWQRYWKDESHYQLPVHIYGCYWSDLYESNEYDIDKAKCYKDLMKHLLTEMD